MTQCRRRAAHRPSGAGATDGPEQGGGCIADRGGPHYRQDRQPHQPTGNRRPTKIRMIAPVRMATVTVMMVHEYQLGLSATEQDRKSTRLNSSHVATSYAAFCLKKKKK